MTEKIDAAKKIVRAYFKQFDPASADSCAGILASHTHEDYQWRGMFPFNEIAGADCVAEQFWSPLKAALSSLQRRADIFFAGHNEIDGFDSVWVASMGHFLGLFDQPFLSIAPTGKIAMLRYAEFHRVQDGKIAETALFFDLLHLMLQAGLQPAPVLTGAHLVQPGPMTHDGLLYASQDPAEGSKTLDLINRMIKDFNQGGYATFQEELQQCWRNDMIWWGPGGIGATYTIDRYIDQHLGPFENQNDQRVFYGHICRMAEGKYGGFFGWPNLSLIPSGGYLGMPPSNVRADMRVVDIYRRDGDKLAENWIFIDILSFLKMQGHDILEQVASQGQGLG